MCHIIQDYLEPSVPLHLNNVILLFLLPCFSFQTEWQPDLRQICHRTVASCLVSSAFCHPAYSSVFWHNNSSKVIHIKKKRMSGAFEWTLIYFAPEPVPFKQCFHIGVTQLPLNNLGEASNILFGGIKKKGCFQSPFQQERAALFSAFERFLRLRVGRGEEMCEFLLWVVPMRVRLALVPRALLWTARVVTQS